MGRHGLKIRDDEALGLARDLELLRCIRDELSLARGLQGRDVVCRKADELGGEKIDIINWDENAAQFIENALSPSKVIFVAVDDEEHSALVVVPDSQLSLAIGKAGQNARLTAKLTGYKIDIKSESQAEEEGLFDEIDFSAAEETEQSEEAAQDNEVQE